MTDPTDKLVYYVHTHSNHPASVKKSLPYRLGIRIGWTSSRKSDYTKRRRELTFRI